MTNHIDLGTVLRQTLAANLYSNLVTRSTGAAVRTQIETLLPASRRTLTVIDLSHVGMIDFSCADEVIAKLLMRRSEELEAYFVFRGISDDHWDAIETVLERHGLALVVERDSGVDLMGVVDEGERRVFDVIRRRGRAECWEVAIDLGEADATVRVALERLWRRRLIMRDDDAFMLVGEIA
jgi:hypothetical protein